MLSAMFSHDPPNGVFKVLAIGGAEVTSFAGITEYRLRHGVCGSSQPRLLQSVAA
jgi:hypothetical protein